MHTCNLFLRILLVKSLFFRFKGKYQMTEYTHIALRLVSYVFIYEYIRLLLKLKVHKLCTVPICLFSFYTLFCYDAKFFYSNITKPNHSHLRELKKTMTSWWPMLIKTMTWFIFIYHWAILGDLGLVPLFQFSM